MLGFTILNPFAQAPAPEALTCTAFVSDVTANQVATATITSTGAVSGTLVAGGTYTAQIPTALNDPSLSPLLATHNVAVTAVNRTRRRC